MTLHDEPPTRPARLRVWFAGRLGRRLEPPLPPILIEATPGRSHNRSLPTSGIRPASAPQQHHRSPLLTVWRLDRAAGALLGPYQDKVNAHFWVIFDVARPERGLQAAHIASLHAHTLTTTGDLAATNRLARWSWERRVASRRLRVTERGDFG